MPFLILKIMNTYSKYCPNVFVAKCDQKHEKGETITLTTKYGKEHEATVFNLVMTKDGFFYYSIVREDGFNYKEYCKRRAERFQNWAESAEKKSTEYYNKSQQHRDFLSLGEPIKVGHHSENRHRKIIKQSWDNMGKSVEFTNKAGEHESRADYWERKANTINLSMPESIEFYEYKLEQAKEKHKNLKDNPELRAHSYSLTYANKEVKEAQKNFELAVKLWGDEESINLINSEKEEKAKTKAQKGINFDALLEKYGGFFFFGSDVEKFKAEVQKLREAGYMDEGEKVMHFGAGLYVPSKHKENFIKGI